MGKHPWWGRQGPSRTLPDPHPVTLDPAKPKACFYFFHITDTKCLSASVQRKPRNLAKLTLRPLSKTPNSLIQ